MPFIASITLANDRPPTIPTRTWGNYFLGQPNVSPNPNPGQSCAFGSSALTCATPNVFAGSILSHNQYVQQWTAAIQHQIRSSVSLDVTYVGTKTTHLQHGFGINDPAPGSGSIQPRRPYPQWGTIGYNVFDGYANYNALQVKVESRAWRDLTLLGAYTFSKCLDRATGFTSAFQSTSYAVCDYDFPEDFTGSFNYALPFGSNKTFLDRSRLAKALLGGFQVAGVLTLRSGAPFSPTISTDRANTGVSGQFPIRLSKPSLVGSPTCWFYVQSNPGCAKADPAGAPAFAVPAQVHLWKRGAQHPSRSNTRPIRHDPNKAYLVHGIPLSRTSRGRVQCFESSNICRSDDDDRHRIRGPGQFNSQQCPDSAGCCQGRLLNPNRLSLEKHMLKNGTLSPAINSLLSRVRHTIFSLSRTVAFRFLPASRRSTSLLSPEFPKLWTYWARSEATSTAARQ